MWAPTLLREGGGFLSCESQVESSKYLLAIHLKRCIIESRKEVTMGKKKDDRGVAQIISAIAALVAAIAGLITAIKL